jgi:hypothetical protein
LRDKILYRRFENGSEEIDQMIVPSRLRQSVLKELHSGIGGGHLGTKKMLKKVKSRLYWPGRTQDVEIYCQHTLSEPTRHDHLINFFATIFKSSI